MNRTASGTGLGFRRELLPELQAEGLSGIDFFEVAPENWMGQGGRHAAALRAFSERVPFVAHGLSLSIGSSDGLDVDLLKSTKGFMATHGIGLYTEHLSWCSHDGHLYDLLPLPCTGEAVRWVAGRIRQAQDILGCRIGIENASSYLSPPGAEMGEADFVAAVLREADCLLHLDVNNVYVNSINFGFDADTYLRTLPMERVCYLHVAGHYRQADGLLIDTHGAAVIDPVWALLDRSYELLGERAAWLPTCLERDFNFPPLAELRVELECIRGKRKQVADSSRKRA